MGSSHPDADIYPEATGPAARIVAEHQEDQPITLYSGCFLKLNPRGLVPTLGAPAKDGTTKPLIESNIISEYLDWAYPKSGPKLFPEDPFENAHMKIWVDHITTRILPAYHRFLQWTEKSPYSLEKAKAEFLGALKTWTAQADVEGPYFLGKDISYADVCLAPWALRMWVFDHFKGGSGIPAPGQGDEDQQVWDRWHKWVEAVQSRKSVTDTLSELKVNTIVHCPKKFRKATRSSVFNAISAPFEAWRGGIVTATNIDLSFLDLPLPTMPRAPRRAAHHAREAATTTPTRPTATNAITAAIPPFMLETPPHAPFLTTPLPPSNNPGNSIVPEANAPRHQQARHQQTPSDRANTHSEGLEQSQISHNGLGSTVSEAGHAEEQSFLESVHHDVEDAKQLRGLRDISSLATWTLSSAKPGCALAQLRNPSPSLFWQSDGPQPHTLTLHFFKLVAIVKMRIYLDFELDESYTPTKMKFFAGMSEGGLVEFGSWEVVETQDPETGETRSSIEGVRGWIDVPLKGVGGRETHYHGDDDMLGNGESSLYPSQVAPDNAFGGDVLKAMVVQVRICENHQNGKDTHVRGFQVFARDHTTPGNVKTRARQTKHENQAPEDDGELDKVVGLQPADWMGDPEIR
ncbi:hypothetical protein LTS15_002398 [Exophiala xenobiotica]|nr:hypothetical protein LTS15_002398 [Exophiala xenobiotica]